VKIDRTSFFDGFRAQIDSTIEQQQVDGLNFLLDKMEADPFWKFIPQISYALATIYHETAGSFQPVEEGYYLAPPQSRVKAFQKKLRYFPYFGRGYVQLTWEKNYEFAGKQLDVDLVDSPELALTPDVAYRVLTMGMHRGWFTGKKLDDFIKGTMKDYVGARQIINGHDKAGLIAGYARNFEQILTNSTAASNDTSPSTHSVVSDATSIPQVDSEQQPSITTSVEQKETQATTSGDTTTTQQTTVTADKNVAVGKEEHVGFLASMWAKITGAIATIGGFSAVTGAAQQAQVFGFTPQFWQSIFTIVAVGVTIWIIVEAIKWFFTVWLKRHRTEKLAELNSTPNNTVVIVPEDQLDQYEKKGWVVIRRN
jgi:hypothetical protein